MQPPSRGCVLKPVFLFCRHQWLEQPPSRGCVLKQVTSYRIDPESVAAASARLCVETSRAS